MYFSVVSGRTVIFFLWGGVGWGGVFLERVPEILAKINCFGLLPKFKGCGIARNLYCSFFKLFIVISMA